MNHMKLISSWGWFLSFLGLPGQGITNWVFYSNSNLFSYSFRDWDQGVSRLNFFRGLSPWLTLCSQGVPLCICLYSNFLLFYVYQLYWVRVHLDDLINSLKLLSPNTVAFWGNGGSHLNIWTWETQFSSEQVGSACRSHGIGWRCWGFVSFWAL